MTDNDWFLAAMIGINTLLLMASLGVFALSLKLYTEYFKDAVQSSRQYRRESGR